MAKGIRLATVMTLTELQMVLQELQLWLISST